MESKFKSAGIIASNGQSADSLYFSAVVVFLSAVGYAIGIITALIVKSI